MVLPIFFKTAVSSCIIQVQKVFEEFVFNLMVFSIFSSVSIQPSQLKECKDNIRELLELCVNI